MKKKSWKLIGLLCILFMNVQFCPAQNWFDGEPNWKYNYSWNCGFQLNGDNTIFYKNDTIIDGVTMKIFRERIYRNDQGQITIDEGDRIMYEESDKVYRYFNDTTSFLLYDFTKEIGDTLSIDISVGTDFYYNFCDSILYMKLDTIMLSDLNSHPVRIQKWELLNNQEEFGEEITIMEKVGVIENFHFEMRYDWNCGLDVCHPYDFNCYYNPALGIAYPENNNCSDIVLSVQSQEKKFAKIYPNPSNGIFFIESESTIKEASIYDINGKLVLNVSQSNEINIQNKPNGIYLLKVVNFDDSEMLQTLIKF